MTVKRRRGASLMVSERRRTSRTSSSRVEWSADAVRAREQAREEERRRLARELHDELGQALLGLKMNLVWLHNAVTGGSPVNAAEIREKVPALLELVDRSIHTVTGIVTDLRPPALDQLGLVAALEWQTESFARRTGLRCKFTGIADVDDLDVGRATAVFRMFQEMLTNVERHAKANHVEVVVRRVRNRLSLSVQDNGIGVPAGKMAEPNSFGLLGMRERAMLLGGTLKIEAPPQRGTTVKAMIPLANRRSRARRQDGKRAS